MITFLVTTPQINHALIYAEADLKACFEHGFADGATYQGPKIHHPPFNDEFEPKIKVGDLEGYIRWQPHQLSMYDSGFETGWPVSDDGKSTVSPADKDTTLHKSLSLVEGHDEDPLFLYVVVHLAKTFNRPVPHKKIKRMFVPRHIRFDLVVNGRHYPPVQQYSGQLELVVAPLMPHDNSHDNRPRPPVFDPYRHQYWGAFHGPTMRTGYTYGNAMDLHFQLRNTDGSLRVPSTASSFSIVVSEGRARQKVTFDLSLIDKLRAPALRSPPL